MAVTLHARVPILGCRGKTCKPSYTSPLASFLDARSGKEIEAQTINGWKPAAPAGDRRRQRSFAANRSTADAAIRLPRREPAPSQPSTLRRFHAVTAVYCSEGQRIYPGQGQWEVFVRKVAVSSVSALQRYYERPDEPDLPKKGICFANLVGVAIPRFRRCARSLGRPGALAERSLRASSGLPTCRSLAHRPRAADQAAHLSPCGRRELPDEVGKHCGLGRTSARFSCPRPALPSSAEDRARLCLPDAAESLRGRALRARLPSRCISDQAVTQSAHRPGTEPRLREAAHVRRLIRSPGSVASVELGGCWRVERPDRLAGTGNQAVARAILDGR